MLLETYVEVNEQYHAGAALDEYQDIISVCSAQIGKDGKCYKRWAFPQVADRKPGEKALPVSIRLGDKDNAIKILKGFIAALSGEKKEEPVKDSVDDDIPF